MVDNLGYSEGVGKAVAADDIGGVYFQRVKNTFGADGSATDVSTAAPMPVQIGDGTDLADVFAGDLGNNGQVFGGGIKTITVNVTASGATTAIDLSNYQVVSFQFTALGSGATFAFQQSADNTNWQACYAGVSASNATFTTAVSPTLGQLWSAPKVGRYFRFNVTGTVTGTYTVTVVLHSAALPWIITTNTYISGTNGALSVSFGTTTNNNDSSTPGALTYGVGAFGWGMTGTTAWERLRVPVITKTATATASGDTVLWTPTSGKKFRLMRYQIQVTADAATSGGAVIDIVLRDNTTALGASYSLYVPAVSGTAFAASANSGWCDLGQGVLSAATNNVLNINLSAALTAGKCRVVCSGIEE